MHVICDSISYIVGSLLTATIGIVLYSLTRVGAGDDLAIMGLHVAKVRHKPGGIAITF